MNRMTNLFMAPPGAGFARNFLLWAVICCSLSGLAQTVAADEFKNPSDPGYVLQKDFDELRLAAGRIKAEEIPGLKQRATAGDKQTQLLLGMLYSLGCGLVPEDDAQALDWFHRADNLGSSIAATMIGNYYEVPGHDQTEAFKWYRQAAANRNAVAEYNVASMYEQGVGTEKSAENAATWYRRAANHGFIHPVTKLQEPLPRLLLLYEQGTAMPSRSAEDNRKEGLALLRSLVDGKDSYAQFLLGQAYEHGLLGLPKDDVQALEWLSKAAETDPRAQMYLGDHYDTGNIVPKDTQKAASFFKMAAENGDAVGQTSLGSIYETGKGVPQDFAKAAKWYQAAAEQFDENGLYLLGHLYESGKGVPKDKVTALMYFILARQMGGPDARRTTHPTAIPGITLTGHFHPNQKDYQEAGKRAKEWKDLHYCRTNHL